MPELCTCGAELPVDARFCHKCGKPQREEPLVTAIPVPPPAPPVTQPIDFHNPLAVRAGVQTALMATLLNVLLVILFPVWLIGAGFLCVYLYRRRSGQPLTVSNGVRIGWIAGTFSCVPLILLTMLTTIYGLRSGQLLHQLEEMPLLQGHMEQLRALFSNPAYLVMYMVVNLVVLFVMVTVLTAAGGALGAKMLGRGRS